MPDNFEHINEHGRDIPPLPEDSSVSELLVEQEATPNETQASVTGYVELAAADPADVFDVEEQTEPPASEPASGPETSDDQGYGKETDVAADEKTLQEAGSLFLHERNTTFHSSTEVETVASYLRANNESIPNEPAAKITAYLGFLADQEYVNDGVLTGDKSSLERQVDARVIKAEDIPESYFELQRRIAREQGHGDIDITPQLRRELTEAVQADQRAGLSKWARYLADDENSYPDWFKRYALESAAKLSTYDKEKDEFQKRSRSTVAPPPELNREALAYVYDALNKSRIKGEEVSGSERDVELQRHLGSGNFSRLYALGMAEVTPDHQDLKEETRGSWVKFDQTDDNPEVARRLADSLQGHGTGWCTAGETTAQHQLKGGDLHVYYSRDKEGRDRLPRVAVRMEGDEVAEVRGIEHEQELEPELADVAAQKLQELPGGEEYVAKAEDMKRLTALEKELAANPDAELTRDDIRFLYEIDRDIEGFGYEPDPRVTEVRRLRGMRDKPELVSLLPELIENQLSPSYEAYREVYDHIFRITKDTIDEQKLTRLFTQKHEMWQANGVYEHLAEHIIKNGGRYSLLAMPNVEVSRDQFVSLALRFGQGQRWSTSTSSLRGHSPWSGNVGGGAVRFSLIPSRAEENMGMALERGRELLQEQQQTHPNLNLHIPSLFDAVGYWYNLRAQAGGLMGPGTVRKTRIMHVDVPLKGEGEGGLYVPVSLVWDNGFAVLASEPDTFFDNYTDGIRFAIR